MYLRTARDTTEFPQRLFCIEGHVSLTGFFSVDEKVPVYHHRMKKLLQCKQNQYAMWIQHKCRTSYDFWGNVLSFLAKTNCHTQGQNMMQPFKNSCIFSQLEMPVVFTGTLFCLKLRKFLSLGESKPNLSCLCDFSVP